MKKAENATEVAELFSGSVEPRLDENEAEGFAVVAGGEQAEFGQVTPVFLKIEDLDGYCKNNLSAYRTASARGVVPAGLVSGGA